MPMDAGAVIASCLFAWTRTVVTFASRQMRTTALRRLMSIRLLQILSEEGTACLARVNHANTEIVALVHGSMPVLETSIGHELIVELDFELVKAWRVVCSFDDDTDSGIFAVDADSGLCRIVGRVHGVMELENGSFVADLYLRNGCDYLAVSDEDLAELDPRVGLGVSLDVEGLCFYPTRC